MEAASETMATTFLPFMNASVSHTFRESSSVLLGSARNLYTALQQVDCQILNGQGQL